MEAIVIGIGCRRCRKLKRMTEEALSELDAEHVALRTVDNLDGICEWGPVLLPALVLGGTLLVSGQVPSKRYLRRLIQERLQIGA